jgi:tetratricopeptide (TPR) repeat protein
MTILNERLADAYSRNKQYKEAVAIFEQLRDGGDDRLGTLQNIGQLYQQLKQYDKARAAYEAMRQAYPKRHEGAMRLCYLVIAEQTAKKNEQRDYTEAQQLYTEAKRLYDARPNASGEDLEMQKLAGVMEELEANGWFDGQAQAAAAVTTTSPATTTRPPITPKIRRLVNFRKASVFFLAHAAQQIHFMGFWGLFAVVMQITFEVFFAGLLAVIAYKLTGPGVIRIIQVLRRAQIRIRETQPLTNLGIIVLRHTAISLPARRYFPASVQVCGG